MAAGEPVIVVDGRTLQPGSREYLKSIERMVAHLSPEELQPLLSSRGFMVTLTVPIGTRLKEHFAGIEIDANIQELRGFLARPATFDETPRKRKAPQEA